MEASCFCFCTRSLWRRSSLSSALRSCQRRRFCRILSCCSGESWSKALRKSSNRPELVEGVAVMAGVADEFGEAEATCDCPVATAKPSKISAPKNPTIRKIPRKKERNPDRLSTRGHLAQSVWQRQVWTLFWAQCEH